MVVRIDKARHERQALRADPDGPVADVPLDVTDGGDSIAGDGDAPSRQQVARHGVEQRAVDDHQVGRLLPQRHPHQPQPGMHPILSGGRQT